ncbi:YczE/YyaS/YitT family protein [Deinococcus sp. Marseille-Q6407]|uniref:YczE/YyaS/YitT family protein n=1 Tax=Deinococcus sp. Marseille-Q6407 TaxID=2969223 RepID=UPI0021BEC042|nr:membrane protein [Deinococcus sp. Marseille-Q6407]
MSPHPEPAAAPLARVSTWGFPARLALLLGGLVLYGLSLRLMIDAGVGVAPWDVLHTGLAGRFPVTVGQASILIGLVIVACSRLLLGQPIGLGTVLNTLLVGLFVALFAGLPAPAGLELRWAELLAGTLLLGLATGTYVAAGLGAGPRDGLVLGLSRLTGLSVARLRTGLELAVLALGWALGGQIGLGTAAFALLSGPAMGWGLGLYGLSRGESRPPVSGAATQR